MSLSPDFMNTMRERLEVRRNELRTRLTRILADQRRDTDALSPDAPDQAIQRENDEVVDSLGIAAQGELEEVEAAIARMLSGHYGACACCRHTIEQKRLEAVPYARVCLSCASAADSRPSAA